MNKLIQRLLIFFIGIPVILFLVYVPVLHHLPFNIVIILFSLLASLEMYNMLSKKTDMQPKAFLTVMSVMICVSAYINIFLIDKNLFPRTPWLLTDIVFVFCVMAVFAHEIFSCKNFDNSSRRIANGGFLLFYAGYLPSFLTRITAEKNSLAYITTFLVMVFISDSAAWLFGMLFGKNNRGKIAASPNKSIAGFIGAYAGCILFAFLLIFYFKDQFVTNHRILCVLVLSIFVCTASIIGDLAESVLKRSAGVKDSGNIILGRGGALDSIDSILAAAPVFYGMLQILFDAI